MKLKIRAITLRDIKKRQLFQKYEITRRVLKIILTNNTLPDLIKVLAKDRLSKLPINSSISRFRNRCILSSRSRGVISDYRISRQKFKQFVREGKIPGVK